MQRGSTHDLDVEVALAQRPLARLTNGGEGLGKEVVEGLAVGQALAEDVALAAQLLVGELLEVLLDHVDLLGDALQLLEDAAFAGTQQLVNDRNWHATLLVKSTVTGKCGIGSRLAVHGRPFRTVS